MKMTPGMHLTHVFGEENGSGHASRNFCEIKEGGSSSASLARRLHSTRSLARSAEWDEPHLAAPNLAASNLACSEVVLQLAGRSGESMWRT